MGPADAGAPRVMDRSGRPTASALLILVIVAASVGSMSAQGGSKQVLVLHATRPDAQFSTIAEIELSRALDSNVDYYSEFIDTTRFPEAVHRTAFAEFLRAKYQERRFDLVI